MPHDRETLCLCYTNQTSSKVPISSSNQDTVRKEGETTFSFPRSSLPRCRVIITQWEVLIRLGILSDANAIRPVWKASGIPSRLWRPWGKTLARSRSVHRLDTQRDPELVNPNSILNADADQVQAKTGTFYHPFQDGYKKFCKTDILSLASPGQDTWYLNHLLQSFLYAKTITKCWCSVGMFFDRYTNFNS